MNYQQVFHHHIIVHKRQEPGTVQHKSVLTFLKLIEQEEPIKFSELLQDSLLRVLRLARIIIIVIELTINVANR